MAGFGPSSGRLVHASEPYGMSVRWRVRSVPPVVGALVFAAVFLGAISGLTLIHENEEILGAILIIAPVTLAAFLVIRAVKAPK
jgi:hypothetical protein